MLGLAFLADVATAGDWHRWRGPNGNGISDETGWLAKWSDDGPRRLWKAKVGTGFSSITVSDGRAYTMGNSGRGRGKEQSDKDARRCFLKAAMMGDATAQRYVAGCYLRGVGGDVNYDEAFRWYTKAFNQGDLKAQAALGDMLDAGQGCDRDADEARTYYRASRAGKSLATKSAATQ